MHLVDLERKFKKKKSLIRPEVTHYCSITIYDLKAKHEITLGTKNSAVSQRRLHQLIVGLLEQTFCWPCKQTIGMISSTRSACDKTINKRSEEALTDRV